MYIIEKEYGAGVFYEDAANELMPEAYAAALEESGLEVVSRPEVDVTQIGKGQNFIFTAEVAVKPEVTLGEYKGLEVEVAPVEVTEEEVAAELKRRKAKRVFCATTFGLFTNGFKKFDEAYENGVIDRVLTTNLVYQPEELLSKPWYINVDMSKYIALLVDTLNHDSSISNLLSPVERIQQRVKEYNETHYGK